MSRPVHKICIDFDGVIYPNARFKGPTVLDEGPMEGALEAIQELSKRYIVLVQSSRCNGLRGFEAVKAWLEYYEFDEFCQAVDYKPVALVYLDDRGICFDGDWVKAIKNIHSFEHWQGGISPYTVNRCHEPK